MSDNTLALLSSSAIADYSSLIAKDKNAYGPSKVVTTAGLFVSTFAAMLAPLLPQNTTFEYKVPSAFNPLTEHTATTKHPTLQSEEVKKFQRLMFGADVDALQGIFDIARAKFSDIPNLTWNYQASIDRDTGEPQLFLRFDTHGMDVDAQMDREIAMHEAIANDQRLVEAKKYNVITVF